jgi:histidine ammonia-lyase
MIPQYTAASLVSQNKQLATPASVDSIVSSNGQEDHVSMGANAALKTVKIMENLKYLLSIELLTAAQAMHLRRPLQTSPALEALLAAYREYVAPLDEDRYLKPDIESAYRFLEKSQTKTFLA